MERDVLKQFYAWKESAQRKPLILKGARQVGKTWLMQTFAQQAYAKSVYINFEDNELCRSLFDQDYDIERILQGLRIATGVSVDKETLIVFDEIQEAPRALTSLKYFYEKAPELHIIAAGSLLGVAMHQGTSFPVGKVDFINVYPMSFLEFLAAIGEQALANLVKEKNFRMLSIFGNKLMSLLKVYYFVGGMPESVKTYAETRDLTQVSRVLQNILDSYDNDFSKHAPNAEVPRIRMVWNSIAAQLSKENKKFIYGMLKEGARAKTFELALEWLRDAGLISKVHRVKKGDFPLNAYEDFSAFKVFMVDVGLLCAKSGVPATIILNGSKIFEEFNGALAEQYVFQQLNAKGIHQIFYWSAENSSGEIDFLVQKENTIIPIEVKAGDSLQGKSLRKFVERYQGLTGIRFSAKDFRQQDWMSNYPLTMCGEIP